MRYLSLMLLAPWLLVLAWAYCSYPKTLPRTAGRRGFDVLVVLAALASCIAAAVHAFDSVALKQVGNFGQESGGIWKQVMPALYGYGAFVLVIAVALWLRRTLWKRHAPTTSLRSRDHGKRV